MKKKKVVKKNSSRKKRSSDTSLYLRYIVIGTSLILLIVGGKFISFFMQPHVLGTSIYLARGGDDGTSGVSGDSGGGSGSSGSSDSNSGSASVSNGSDSQSGSGNNTFGGESVSSDFHNQTVNTSVSPSLSGDTQVDCVGPDGKHFVTSFHDCQELNQKWGHTTFDFTPISTTQTSKSESEINNDLQQTEKPKSEAPKTNLEVQKEGNKGELNLETAGMHVEIKQEDNGALQFIAHKSDGTEIKLKTKDALTKINDSLKENDIEVGTDSANGVTIRHGETEAQTHFPLSIDPLTGQLTITTPSGVKNVAILPDEAVKAILAKGILSSAESQTSLKEGSTSASQKVTLTELDNQATFEINGVSNKKVFGLIPASFAKKVFVSAETGTIIKTDETLFTKILEAMSF